MKASGGSGPSRTGEGVRETVMWGSSYGGGEYAGVDIDRGQAAMRVKETLLIRQDTVKGSTT